MEDNDINSKDVCDILNEIMEYELAGVVRYTHSSMELQSSNTSSDLFL